jgi:hypothetical protein
MLILKRLTIWFIEMASEILLFGAVLTILLGHDQNAFAKDLLIYSSGISLLFFTTGYFLSTIVVRAIWRGRAVWPYPVMATVLFFIHFEIMNVGLRGAFEPADRLRIRAIGACIVFTCTFAGSIILRKWALAHRKSADVPNGR